MVVQHGNCNCHWSVHLKMIQMVIFMLYVSHHSKKKFFLNSRVSHDTQNGSQRPCSDLQGLVPCTPRWSLYRIINLFPVEPADVNTLGLLPPEGLPACLSLRVEHASLRCHVTCLSSPPFRSLLKYHLIHEASWGALCKIVTPTFCQT